MAARRDDREQDCAGAHASNRDERRDQPPGAEHELAGDHRYGFLPFIGLFGTVLGIIDAFQQLAVAGSTSMQTVAPGIAAALITTGDQAFVAIPAAVFYNFFGNAARCEMGARLEDFSLEFPER